jgi:fructose-1-phosphate kinase PfkB-like protein
VDDQQIVYQINPALIKVNVDVICGCDQQIVYQINPALIKVNVDELNILFIRLTQH